LAPSKEDKLTFGKLLKPSNITDKTFAKILEVDGWFVDELIEMNNAEYWFQIDVLGVEAGTDNPPLVESDEDLITRIREATLKDHRLRALVKTSGNKDKGIMVADGVVYDNGRIVVPARDNIKAAIVHSLHDSKPAGHPGRARTLALVQQCFKWPSQKRFVNQYVDGCDSCQRVKAMTQRP
jgi:hypothetical protein